MTRWLLEVKISGVKFPVYVESSEIVPRPAFETMLEMGVFDPAKQIWYPPSRIVEAKVAPVSEPTK